MPTLELLLADVGLPLGKKLAQVLAAKTIVMRQPHIGKFSIYYVEN